jgi:hypothetical protein
MSGHPAASGEHRVRQRQRAIGERPQFIARHRGKSGGAWHSYYDDVTVTNASDLDVDHVVSAPTAS